VGGTGVGVGVTFTGSGVPRGVGVVPRIRGRDTVGIGVGARPFTAMAETRGDAASDVQSAIRAMIAALLFIRFFWVLFHAYSIKKNGRLA
jgi:hypothetical protein